MSRSTYLKLVGILILCLAAQGAVQSLAQESTPASSQPALDTRQQIEAHSRAAQSFLSEKKTELAIPEFRAIVQLDPANIEAHANLGVLLYFAGKYSEAIPELRTAVQLQPGLFKIQALLGMAEKRSGDSASARTDLERAVPELQEKKLHIEAGLQLIEIYSAAEELDSASILIGILHNIDPENQEVLYASYRIHSDLAREAMLSLSITAPKSAIMYQMIAHELARRGDSATAIKSYREALKIDPNLPGLHFELAEMLSTLPVTDQTRSEAKSEYEAALLQNPLDEKAILRLGESADRDNDLKKAHDLYARAVALEPNDPAADEGLAKVLVSMDQPDEARKLFERALQLDPTNPIIHFRLSALYRQMGRTEDMKHEIDEYRKYKSLKEKLRDTYHNMHLDADTPEPDDPELKK
jgi:tetratricopeptide (TPR) repeat protein